MTFSRQRVVVMGLGRFGGGVGVTRFLAARGASVLVTDKEPADALRKSVAQLADLPGTGAGPGVEFRLGEHRESDFASADLVVVNPAVDPRGNPYLQAAIKAGVPLTSEIRLLIGALPRPREQTLGITGSAGKSTTTAMTAHILRRALGDDRVHVGGNLGGSLLGDLDRIRPDDRVVLELSSFMLEDMRVAGERWSPHVAVMTNITENHLDRHGTFEALTLAKQELLEHQRQEDHAVLGRPIPFDLIHPKTTRLWWLDGLDTMAGHPVPKLVIPGEHNVINARLAVEAAACTGIDRYVAARTLEDFPGLTHRLQFVAEHGSGSGSVRYFNDSKATTPEAAELALRSFPAGVVHVVLGGYDKKSDLTGLARFARQHAQAIYTIGATGDALASAAESAEGTADVVRCGTLDKAVESAVQRVRQGDVVLLSPGCASWDQFENFEARGAAFVAAVLRCTGEGAPLPGA